MGLLIPSQPCRVALAAVAAAILLGWPTMGRAQPNDEQWRAWRRKRPLVAHIDVEGSHALAAHAVRKFMQIRTPGFFARLGLRDRPHLLVGAEARDEDAIRRAYRQRGYWDATVAISAAPDEKSGAVVTVYMIEGGLYHWGAVTLTGDDSTLVDRASRYPHDLTRGQPADSMMMVWVTGRIRVECADRAHPGARVNVAVTARSDTLDVAFSLQARSEIALGDLAIAGATFTRESLIRREMDWQPGELYSQKRLTGKQQDLYATGLFTYVHLDPVNVDTTASTAQRREDFQLRVVERKPSYVGFNTGAGQDPDRDLTFDYAFEWGSRNWMGTGRQWSLTAQSSFVVVTDWRVLHHRFAAKYTEPWLFGVRLPTTLTLAYEPGVRSAKQDYRIETISGELNVTRRFRRVNRWLTSLVYERVVIYGIPEDRQNAFLQEQGISVNRRWTAALERDTRPNLFVPTAGAHTRVDAQYVGGILGGAYDFYKVDMTWSRYQVVSTPTVLATRLRVAWANNHSGGDFIPTADRFYLGGAATIRGYGENRVGPADSSGAPTGGQVVGLANVELRAPVSSRFWFTLFADAGNNFDRFADVEFDRMLLSIGSGVLYMTPVGPIRLDYARRAVHPGYPKSDRLHLSILFAF